MAEAGGVPNGETCLVVTGDEPGDPDTAGFAGSIEPVSPEHAAPLTPECNYSVPCVLKNAIDRASRPYGGKLDDDATRDRIRAFILSVNNASHGRGIARTI